MAASTASESSSSVLEQLSASAPHRFVVPVKRIHEGQDVSMFLVSCAYKNIMTFMFQLNKAMFPRYEHAPNSEDKNQNIVTFELGSSTIRLSKPVQALQALLSRLESFIQEAPPDTGPRRFGNVSFRIWHGLLEARVSALLDEFLPADVLKFGQTHHSGKHHHHGPASELSAYLLGAFGSPQRLDFGTGHELSFLAFVACVWKLRGFNVSEEGEEERGIVIGVFERYFNLCRTLIKTYTLEPAGSHGVWGLDDHFFLPYIFGSAQLSAPISPPNFIVPTEGSLSSAPKPGDVAKANIVARERGRSMYFSAIGFIYDVKSGPFWEHSPILYDISGVPAGWAKINKGMLKMYSVEVLSKFPVVQHFPFGSLFSFDRDSSIPPPSSTLPSALDMSRTPHLLNQPQTSLMDPMSLGFPTSRTPSTVAPWISSNSNNDNDNDTRPRTVAHAHAALGSAGAPQAAGGTGTGRVEIGTRAPWASTASTAAVQTRDSPPTSTTGRTSMGPPGAVGRNKWNAV